VFPAVTHLHQTRPLEREAVLQIREAKERGTLSGRACTRLLAGYDKGVARRGRQLRAVTERLQHLAPNGRSILGGDFNAEPGSEEIRILKGTHGFIDTYAQAGTPPGYTWDPENNTNTAVSSGAFLGRNIAPGEICSLLQEQDMRQGRLDYIFLGPGFTRDQVLTSELFATRPASGGPFSSDHFGVITTIRFGSR